MARSADFNSFLTRIAEAAGLSDASFVSIVTNCDRVIALVRAGRAAEASQTPATGAPETPKAAIIPEPPAQAPRGKAAGTGWARILDATERDLGKKR